MYMMNLFRMVIEKEEEEDSFFFFSTLFVDTWWYYKNGDDMKKIMKGIFVPLIVSVLFGFVCGKFVYGIYKDDVDGMLNSSRVYLLHGNTYATYDGMRKENISNNYVYYVDDNEYKTVFGITKNMDNAEKINKLYDNGLNILEYYISNDKLNNKQDEYDNLLKDTSNNEKVMEVVNNILNMYKEDDTVRLVLID